jgi:Spy/CpxP family protein refolding chaperone
MRRLLFFALLIFALMIGPLASAQAPRPSFPWWENPVVVNKLDLSDAQTKQITATVSEYREKLRELRTAVNRADAGLESVLNEDPVDQKKANDAIEQIANARTELFRTTSQMDLKLRSVLTAQQWQELRSQQQGRGPRPAGRRGRGPKGPPSGSAPAVSKSVN